MVRETNAWTLENLERYADGELDGRTHAELSEDLRCDHRLRARLAEISSLDALLAAALTNDVASWGRRGGGGAVIRRWAETNDAQR